MSRTVRIAAMLIAAGVVLLGVRVAMIFAHPPSDQELIQQSLTESLEASRKGQPGGVLDLLSNQFTVDKQNVGDNSQVADFIRKYKPDIELENRNAVVTGSEARIDTAVDLTLLGQKTHLNDVMLVFRKEEGRGFLFLPAPKWRLIEVHLSNSQLSNLTGP